MANRSLDEHMWAMLQTFSVAEIVGSLGRIAKRQADHWHATAAHDPTYANASQHAAWEGWELGLAAIKDSMRGQKPTRLG